MKSRWLGAVVALGSSLLAAGQANAQTAVPPAEPGPSGVVEAPPVQENFGMGAQLGFFNPSGLSVRAGARALSLDVSAGFVPVLLSYGGSRSPDLKFIAPFEVSPQLLIDVVQFKHEMRGGLRLGYRYNTALGHAATLGGQIGKHISPHLLLEGVWGLSYYPRASDRLRGDQVPAGTSFNFPPELGYGLTVDLLYYP